MTLPTRHHIIKMWQDRYEDLVYGRIPYSVRDNDRRYQKGDLVTVRAWDPQAKDYTGESGRWQITNVESGFGLQPGYVILMLEPLP